MDQLLDTVSSVAWLVYLLTFILLFVETSGLPLPALSFALLAATLAGNGTIEFFPVVLATILGGTLGGPVGYAIGLRGGRPVLERMGGKVGLTPERLDTTEEKFKGRGRTFVLVRFFVPILPWSAGLFAGIVRMQRRTLVLFTFFSITLWALIELTLVAFFSAQLKNLLDKFSASCIVWLVTGAVGIYFLVRAFRRRQAARIGAIERDEEAEPEPGSPPATGAATPSASATSSFTASGATETAPDGSSQDRMADPGPSAESAGQLPGA